MGNIVSSIVVAIVTAICTVLGTLYVQKRKNESAVRKCRSEERRVGKEC